VNIQRLFGSQRALKSVEDFTEFEQRAAYFDGDPVIATKKGVNILERASQVHFMAEFQELLDFPPAPKLNVFGNLDPRKASEAEIRGQQVFSGKGRCAVCHPAPYYTDNLMHNLRTERFFEPQMVNGRMAASDGPIKTFVLRGIKDSPPYLHDGRLLTLEDTVEFFNLVLDKTWWLSCERCSGRLVGSRQPENLPSARVSAAVCCAQADCVSACSDGNRKSPHPAIPPTRAGLGDQPGNFLCRTRFYVLPGN
jgi:cytochrome c peroxidase